MTVMSKYCKAYPIEALRQFAGWSEQAENARERDWVGADGRFVSEAFLFVQENLVVTDGVIKNANIIFDRVTPEWRRFCEEVLQFPKESIVEDAPVGDGAAAPAVMAS